MTAWKWKLGRENEKRKVSDLKSNVRGAQIERSVDRSMEVNAQILSGPAIDLIGTQRLSAIVGFRRFAAVREGLPLAKARNSA